MNDCSICNDRQTPNAYLAQVNWIIPRQLVTFMRIQMHGKTSTFSGSNALIKAERTRMESTGERNNS
jgi:hypothetical protein